jgi:hypothetical protein
MQTSEKKKYINSFGVLWYELKSRFMAPVGQVSFWVFLILGVFLFSACGVWVELGKYILSSSKNLDGIQTAIFTFFPALACTATMQIIFSDKEKKPMKSIAYLVGILLLLAAIGLLSFAEHFTSTVLIRTGVVASILAIITWWIANGEDPIFNDNVSNPDIPTGGDTKALLNGDISGFKTD